MGLIEQAKVTEAFFAYTPDDLDPLVEAIELLKQSESGTDHARHEFTCCADTQTTR